MHREFAAKALANSSKRVEIGTTWPGPPDVGMAYLGITARYGNTGRTQWLTAHFDPADARAVAYALLDAADQAECDLTQQQVQSTEDRITPVNNSKENAQ